jgi:hypothetical protein
VAYGGLNVEGSIIDAVAASTFTNYQVSTGYAVGGGVEQDLLDRWTWKAEYLLVDLKMPSSTFATSLTGICGPGVACAPPLPVHFDPRFVDNIVRLELDYHWKP